MPTKNVAKVFVPNAFFHVYNRGWNLGDVFFGEADYRYFEQLLARHLSPQPILELFSSQEHTETLLLITKRCNVSTIA